MHSPDRALKTRSLNGAESEGYMNPTSPIDDVQPKFQAAIGACDQMLTIVACLRASLTGAGVTKAAIRLAAYDAIHFPLGVEWFGPLYDLQDADKANSEGVL